VTWRWQAPGGLTGSVKYRVVQVEGPAGNEPVGFDSGEARPAGSFSWQFALPGVYYYWSGFVDAGERVSFRGVVQVLEAVDRELEVDVTLSGATAQKCVFPFVYNAVSYESCTNVTMGYLWCSPTRQFSGQRINCSVEAESDGGASVDLTGCRNGTG